MHWIYPILPHIGIFLAAALHSVNKTNGQMLRHKARPAVPLPIPSMRTKRRNNVALNSFIAVNPIL